jgi:hypothetical protein
LGVEAVAVKGRFETPLAAVPSPVVEPGRVDGRGPYYALGHATGDLIALGRLLRAKVPVRWATARFQDRGHVFEAGTLLVPSSARASLEAMARELGLVARAVSARPEGLALSSPRIGLYQSYDASMDEGWTRYVFDKDLDVRYATLHDKDVRAGGLRSRFDAIVLPDQSPSALVEGRKHGSLPDEYAGGLGEEGVAALEAFVKDGGTLVALNGAALLPVQDFGLGVSGAIAHEAKAPGSILRATVKGDHPLTHGLGDTSMVWFSDSPAFTAPESQVALAYTEPNPLLSGYLETGHKLTGKAALVEAPLGRGRVVLFGFRPQYRALSWATYVPFANALYLSAARAD